MIKVSFKTNLDDYRRERWPTGVVVAPREGDIVISDSGKMLQVAYISHCMSHSYISSKDREPMIEVYLRKVI